MKAGHNPIWDVGGGVGTTVHGPGETYRGRLRRRTPCLDCRVELTAGSMTENIQSMHGMEPEMDWNRLTVSKMEYIPQVFDISLLKEKTQ